MKINKLAVLTVFLLATGLSSTAVRANSIPNPNFTLVGPSGSPFTTSISTNTSAAADWGTFVPVPNSTATTELFASTDNLSGDVGNMLSFSTNAGFHLSDGNGVFTTCCFFTVPAGTVGFMDINVTAGTTGELGFVESSGAFSAGSYSFSGTSGWQRVSFSTTGASGELGFEIFSNGGGSMYVADPTAPTPEPGTLLLLASGLTGIGFIRRRFSSV